MNKYSVSRKASHNDLITPTALKDTILSISKFNPDASDKMSCKSSGENFMNNVLSPFNEESVSMCSNT